MKKYRKDKHRENRAIRGRDDVIFDAVTNIVLVLLSLFFLLPFLNVIALSVSSSEHVIRGDVYFWPKGLSGAAYASVMSGTKVIRAFFNSIFLSAVGCVLSLLMTAVAAYPLVFSDAPGKKLYNLLIMITHFFSAGLVPTFVVVSKYGLVNSYWSLILLSLISAYNVLVIKAYYVGLPKSLVESARIDGANDWLILFRIIIPLAKPALATVAMWIIVGHWNNYLGAAIYIKSPEKYTLQLVLRDMLAQSKLVNGEGSDIGESEQLRYAVCTVAMLPMLAIYPFFQRYFVKGVMIGAVKG